MTDTTDHYVEDENFIPEPTAQFGTLDTSGTAGSAHAKIEEISPVFEVADKQNAEMAARALDPEDTEVPASLVVLPEDGISRDEAIENVKARAEALADKDVSLSSSRLTPAQEEAAQSGEEAGAKAEAETGAHGAAGGLDGSGTGQTVDTTGTDGDDKSGESKTAAKKATSSTKSK